jgi:2-oxoisovalerate dehydrogenase E2 component (dihydrolipoyl transacylase)
MMATQVRMPQLGESVTEGTVVRWLKQPGQHVAMDEPLAEVETEKVNVEIPSPFEGTLAHLLVTEGTTVDVGTPIAEIQEVGATASAPTLTERPTAAEPTAAAPPPVAPPPAAPVAVSPRQAVPAFQATGPLGPASLAHGMFSTAGGEAAPTAPPAPAPPIQPPAANGHAMDGTSASGRYSPAVLQLAQEHGVDLSQLSGSGLGGRITRKDVQRWIDQHAGAAAGADGAPAAQSVAAAGVDEPLAPHLSQEVQEVQRAFEEPLPADRTAPAAAHTIAPAEAPPAVPAPVPAALPAVLGPDEELEPLTATRRAIARHMVRSVQTAPHAWMVVEVDVSRLVTLREAAKERFRQSEGVDLTYLPFMIKATVAALKQQPRLNSSWSDDGIILKRRINIGVAVNSEQGLLVPVIHDADGYSIAGLAKRLVDLADRARTRRLRMEDVEGGTFTVDNVGPLGSIVSQPIINQPQCAIVTMESIVKRPVVVGDAIAVRSMLNCCISFDHRIVDGGDVGPFMRALKSNLESFGPETPLY